MAKKQQSSKSEFDFAFVECDLRSADKEHFQGWQDEHYDDLEVILTDLMREGYRITLKFDFNNACFSASMTQQDSKHTNSNKVLMARAGYPMEVLSMILYKHIVKLQGGDWPTLEQKTLWG